MDDALPRPGSGPDRKPARKPHLNPDRIIALVGLMGAGKSTVGRRLARRLGLPFVDSDREIEIAAGRTINEIFEQQGEAEFRDGERRVIARLLDGPPRVIATGGGAFIDPETRALILEKCIAIWLDVDVETLAERVSRRAHRPLVRGTDPAAMLTSLAEIRNPIYAEAQIRICGSSVPHEQLVDSIIEGLAARQVRG